MAAMERAGGPHASRAAPSHRTRTTRPAGSQPGAAGAVPGFQRLPTRETGSLGGGSVVSAHTPISGRVPTSPFAHLAGEVRALASRTTGSSCADACPATAAEGSAGHDLTPACSPHRAPTPSRRILGELNGDVQKRPRGAAARAAARGRRPQRLGPAPPPPRQRHGLPAAVRRVQQETVGLRPVVAAAAALASCCPRRMLALSDRRHSTARRPRRL